MTTSENAGLVGKLVGKPGAVANSGAPKDLQHNRSCVVRNIGDNIARLSAIPCSTYTDEDRRSMVEQWNQGSGSLNITTTNQPPSSSSNNFRPKQARQHQAEGGGGKEQARVSSNKGGSETIATYTASLAATKPSQRIILPTSGVSIGVQAAPTGWTRYYFDDKQIQRAVQPRSFGGTKKMLLNAEAKGRWKVSRNTEEEGTTQKREKAASDI
ncbi:hypothetical protein PPROV_000639900 [Pycnococcus provasolii]|uniref:Uncharacterized protein n=1 Tax=Pycnococcus provasolii TaxID=41880 RepID=A0A830HRS8_9CHLO|nr:hypothetical protein PPROV_000639900 [Pycnococcus provasolii]